MDDKEMWVVNNPECWSKAHGSDGEFEVVLWFVVVDHDVKEWGPGGKNHTYCEAEVLEVDRSNLILKVGLVKSAQLSVELD